MTHSPTPEANDSKPLNARQQTKHTEASTNYPSFLGFCYYPVQAVWQNHFNVTLWHFWVCNSRLWVATSCVLMICLLLPSQLFKFYPPVVVLVVGCHCCSGRLCHLCSDCCSNNCDLFYILFHFDIVTWISQWKYIEQISTKHQLLSNFKHRSGRCRMIFITFFLVSIDLWLLYLYHSWLDCLAMHLTKAAATRSNPVSISWRLELTYHPQLQTCHHHQQHHQHHQ